MLIAKLKNEICPVAQAALVSNSRSTARNCIVKMVCPNELLRYSERIYKISKQHPAANSLQREAELATQKSVQIQSQSDYIAWTVVRDGFAYFRQQGKNPNYRLYGMRNRYGSWAAVHARLVQNCFGGKNFEWMRKENKLELTSEWFIARHARNLVSSDMLVALDKLLSSDVATYDMAA